MRLYQISGKKLLQTFVHSEASSADTSLPKPPPTTILPPPPPGTDTAMDVDGQEEEGAAEGEGGVDIVTVALSVECVGFAGGDYRWVASGGMDSFLKVWDMVTGSCRLSCKYEYICIVK